MKGNWFYSEDRSVTGAPMSYHAYLPTGNDARPGNAEDAIVMEFLARTFQLSANQVQDIEGELRIALRRAADAAVRTTLDAEKPAGVVYETAEERATKKVVRPERASGQDNWTPPIAISALKEVLMKAEDDGAGGVNLTLGYAAVALIERLEHIADALEAKAARP